MSEITIYKPEDMPDEQEIIKIDVIYNEPIISEDLKYIKVITDSGGG